MSDNNDAAVGPVLDPFEQWLSERHKWLQTAAARLIRTRAFPDADAICELADLCVIEASKQGVEKFEAVAPGVLAQAQGQSPIRLRRISEVTGVNAIKNGASIEFGTSSISLVYGSNGSGKSGFARLIKQLCGSRAKEDLLGNVFSNEQQEPSARVLLSVGEKEKEGIWTLADGAVPQLRHLHVFDSTVAALYFGQKNEATYEPSRMRFVSSLIRVCDQVSDELDARKQKLQTKLPIMPAELAATKSGRFVSKLKAGTTEAAIASACVYTDEMNNERIAGEASLAEKDVPGRLKVIDREIAALDIVKALVQSWKTALSDEKLTELAGARAAALQKRKAAGEDAAKVFAGSPVDGIGQESWHDLWEKAREFSVSYAYKESEFPNTEPGARCVLCQQELGDDAKDRLSHFERFVKGELEKDAQEAERALKKLEQSLPNLPEAKTWVVTTAPIKLEHQAATDWLTQLSKRRSAADIALTIDAVTAVDWSVVELPMIVVTDALLAEQKTLQALLQDGNRKELAARVSELVACQWLNREQEAVRVEVKRLDTLAILQKSISLTSTTALTKKNTELAEQELRGGYQERFERELKALNGSRIPIEPRSKQQGKGKVTFSLTLKDTGDGVRAESVLSEGERRIIAMAAFLADISGSGQPTPFVFDDPISSLDQDFEEHVVKRLVDLSHERQVIIFTHRLSLVAQVESLVKKIQDKAFLAKQPTPIELNSLSLRRLGKTVGLIADINIRDAKPDKALNRIRNESLKQLRKLHDEADVAGYDEKVKGICSDVRILVEKCVETILLNDVLIRFRRSITTQNKIGKLAKIKADDCALIDDLMTRYSVFEHSQSTELPAECPDVDVLEKDVDVMIAWIKEFTERPVQ
ncbi:AAA family ATPase [Caballeronia sp. LP006]|uniref:AAA family ATPase n=1 Tax=Caballeronia sp. LP006 TaxID=3038552 RepID=UPI002859EF4A|nr:AAA family ATPase [Caballeronia sp. LP006]MDR5826247.1 AAA family ATPase [Caballeronia sp. LP006]